MAGVPPNASNANPPARGFIGAQALRYFNMNDGDPQVAPAKDNLDPYPEAGIFKLESEARSNLWSLRNELEAFIETEWDHCFMNPLLSMDVETVENTVGSRFLKQPMQTHPESLIQAGPDLDDLIAALEGIAPSIQDPATKNKLQSFLSIYTATNSLKGLHRFLHRDQARLTGQVEPDGSNLMDGSINPIRNRALQLEWRLHRHWIRFLHYLGIFYNSVKSSIRFHRFGAVYRIGRYLHAKEIDYNWPNNFDNYELNPEDENASDLEWLWNSRNTILGILQQVSSLAFLPPQPRPVQRALSNMGVGQQPPNIHTMLTREKRLDWNLKYDPNLLDNMLNLLNQLIAQHPFEHLILDLLVKEDTFERQLATEHVEDMLINKQISTFDEENFAQTSYAPHYHFHHLNDPVYFYSKVESWTYKVLEETALVNRQRRNFRLLRDWQKKRPWKQIYQLYDDTLPENQWLTAAIQNFQGCTYLPDRKERPGPETELTSYRAVAPSLFGFMPLLLSSLPPNHPLLFPCALCSKNFIGNQDFGSSVVKLHCTAEHHFHLNCIFTFWDQPGKYLHRCPTCRDAAQLNWQRVDIDPYAPNFAHNIWGWKVSKDTIDNLNDDTEEGRRARDLYDVPPLPGPIDFTNPEDVHDGARKWWMQENMARLCMLENPVTWQTQTFEPYELARTRRPVLQRNQINPHPYDAVATEIGTRWMNLEFDTGGRTRDPNQDVFGTATARFLPRARHEPSVEAAWGRHDRRRRDRQRRQKVQASGSGLGSLPGV